MVELGLLRSLYVTLSVVAIWSELSLGAPIKSQGKGPDADKFLEKYGYLSRKGTPHSNNARRQALKAFQKMAHLKVTGDLDTPTITKMKAPRCGVQDAPLLRGHKGGRHSKSNKARQSAKQAKEDPTQTQSFNSPGVTWTKNELSWKALDYSPDLPEESQRNAFSQAFTYWAAVIPLEFSETNGTEADIRIKFAEGDHGDGAQNAFDGPGKIIAHAFFPEDGDTHFDEAETWTEGTPDGINLEQVAAHEFGHAIGLGHSEVEEALMAPYYKGYDPNLQLDADDILAAQALYGPPAA